MGIFAIALGAATVSSFGERVARRGREWVFALMPWLQKIPGVRQMYTEDTSRMIGYITGSAAVVVGLLLIAGKINFG